MAKITWFAAILTFDFINSTMATMATSVALPFSQQKKGKDQSFVVF